MIALHALKIVPYCVQYGGLYFCANQWRALVQEYGAVFCIQQLRTWGSEALVRELIDFLTTSIIQSQTNIGITLALKTLARLRHHCVDAAGPAKRIERMKTGIGSFANRQFNSHRGQIFHQVGLQKRRGRHAVPEIADGGQLCVIPGQKDLGASQSNFCHDIQQGNLAHEALVKAERALKIAFLDPMLQSGQSLPGVELACRDVRSYTASDTVKLLKATTHQMRLADTRGPIQKEIPLFTSELQRQLFDVDFTFTENLDSWQKVGGCSCTLVEEDAFLLLSG